VIKTIAISVLKNGRPLVSIILKSVLLNIYTRDALRQVVLLMTTRRQNNIQFFPFTAHFPFFKKCCCSVLCTLNRIAPLLLACSNFLLQSVYYPSAICTLVFMHLCTFIYAGIYVSFVLYFYENKRKCRLSFARSFLSACHALASEILRKNMQEAQNQVVEGHVEASTDTAENKGGLRQIGECHE
jgi:hypothetical protein